MHCNMSHNAIVWGGWGSGRSKGGREGRAPPLAQNFFIFMQFSGKIGQIIGWRPPFGISAPSSGKSWIRHWEGPPWLWPWSYLGVGSPNRTRGYPRQNRGILSPGQDQGIVTTPQAICLLLSLLNIVSLFFVVFFCYKWQSFSPVIFTYLIFVSILSLIYYYYLFIFNIITLIY